jgi:hypothetical protein
VSFGDDRRARLLYAVGSVALFLPLYLLTRSRLLISDGPAFLAVARAGDAAAMLYGDAAHFLQIPLSHAWWRAMERVGLGVPIEAVYLGIGLVGALVSIIFVGLIAGELLGPGAACWVAGVLFGTSLVSWTQWNGELYSLALAFATAAVYASLRGQGLVAAVLFAFTAAAHSEFVLMAPVFLVSTWIVAPADMPALQRLLRGVVMLVVAGMFGIVVIVAGGWFIGKWHDVATLTGWFGAAFGRRSDHISGPEVLRAAKGLLTAFNVGGHVAGDIIRRHGPAGRLPFMLAAAVALPILATTVVLAAGAVRRPRLFVLAAAWLLPIHLLFNWYFAPAVEEYHAAALPAFVLLVTGGLFSVATTARTRLRRSLVALYVVLCAGLNLFAGVLPMKAYAEDAIRGARDVAALNKASANGAVFVTCTDYAPIALAAVVYLNVYRSWVRHHSLPPVESDVSAWVTQRFAEGRDVYVVGRSCPLHEWTADAPHPEFSLGFLDGRFQFTETAVKGLPRISDSATNPFSWTRVDVYRLVARS